MANYATLKAAVADVVKTNGTQAITGANLQAVLLSIINSVGGGGYIFKGVATPSTDAGTPDYNVAYIGGAGTYANFGTSVTVPVGSIGVFKYNGSWAKETITMFAGIDDVPTAWSDNLVKSGGVYDKISEIKIGKSIPFGIRNGSQGNGGNSWVVTIKGTDGYHSPIPVTAGVKYKVIINKQPVTGYEFFMRIVTYSTTTPTDLESQTVRNEVNNWNKYYKSGDDILINSGEVALSIQLTELSYAGAPQASGTCIALREADFVNGDIEVIDISGLSLVMLENKTDDLENKIDDLENKIDQDIEEIYTTLGSSNIINAGDDIRNGSVGNWGNAYCISVMNRISVDGFNNVCLFTNRPNSENCVYRWIYRTYNTVDGSPSDDTGLIVDNNDYTNNNYPTIFSISPNEKAIAFGVTEYNTLTSTISSLRITDFDGFYIGVARFSAAGLIDDILNRLIELEEGDEATPDAAKRYLDKTGALCGASRLYAVNSSSKDLQFIILTDVHGDRIATENSAKIASAFNTVDALMCLGDIVPARYSDSFKTTFSNIMGGMNKPYYVCLGNHDVGNAKYIGFCATHQQAYDSFIKPIVDAGYLVAGEYTAGLSYYFHDFSAQKVRLIVINEYDEPLDFDNTYWNAITYDSSLPNVAESTSYSVGDKVSVQDYTGHSFVCINSVTTPSSFYVEVDEQIKFPSYRIMRGYRVIRQTQAQWLLDTLASTPSNYGVVIATHQAWSENAQNQQEYKFAQDVSFQSTSLLQNYMATDFIANAVNAFVNGNNYSENVAMKGAAAYLNTQGENTYAYSVSKDFSLKNTGVKFLCFIGGHTHRDLIFKHTVYPQYQICPICATTGYANNIGNDIKREDTRVFGDGYGVDSLTSISFDYNGLLRLVKIGVETTTAMTLRDQELLNLNE